MNADDAQGTKRLVRWQLTFCRGVPHFVGFDLPASTVKLVLVNAVLIAGGILLFLAAIQAICSWHDRQQFPPPGTVVDGLHVLKQGEGKPVVVFEAGLGASSLSWVLVQPRVAMFAATVAYDRAGFGWSRGLRSRTCLENIAEDLHRLVSTLNLSRPFILVGHSLGGYITRFYAHLYPQDVAGLVLVDPGTSEEWMEPTAGQRWRLRRAAWANRLCGLLAYFGLVRFALWLFLMRTDPSPGPLSRFSTTLQRIRAELLKFPPETRRLVRVHWSRPGFFWAMAAYLQAVPECAKEASKCSVPAHVPVTVISGVHQPPELLAQHGAMATNQVIAPMGQ